MLGGCASDLSTAISVHRGHFAPYPVAKMAAGILADSWEKLVKTSVRQRREVIEDDCASVT
jgi:hypothetical protein